MRLMETIPSLLSSHRPLGSGDAQLPTPLKTLDKEGNSQDGIASILNELRLLDAKEQTLLSQMRDINTRRNILYAALEECSPSTSSAPCSSSPSSCSPTSPQTPDQFLDHEDILMFAKRVQWEEPIFSFSGSVQSERPSSHLAEESHDDGSSPEARSPTPTPETWRMKSNNPIDGAPAAESSFTAYEATTSEDWDMGLQTTDADAAWDPTFHDFQEDVGPGTMGEWEDPSPDKATWGTSEEDEENETMTNLAFLDVSIGHAPNHRPFAPHFGAASQSPIDRTWNPKIL